MRVEEALALIDARIAELRRIQSDAKNAIEVLESLKNDKELIVPIGGGVFVKTEWKEESLLDVGGGIIIEKKTEEIIERLKKRVERAEKEIQKLEEEKRNIINQVRGQQ